MSCICGTLLMEMLNTCSPQELRDLHALVYLGMPWVLLELVLHAYLFRRVSVHACPMPEELSCLEFFAGSTKSSQLAEAFGEIGVRSLAFDIQRGLP